MKLDAQILEVNGGTYEGSPWKSLIARVEGKLMKFKVLSTVDTSDIVDKTVELQCDIFGTASQSAYLKVVAIN